MGWVELGTIIQYGPRGKEIMMMQRYRNKMFLFVSIWCCVAVWQVLVMFLAFGYDLFDFFLLGFACYISSVGYLILHISGPCWQTMRPSEWQWITGIAIMFLLGVLATFPQNRIVRNVSRVLFVLSHVVGSLCSFASMVCAKT